MRSLLFLFLATYTFGGKAHNAKIRKRRNGKPPGVGPPGGLSKGVEKSTRLWARNERRRICDPRRSYPCTKRPKSRPLPVVKVPKTTNK